jgi:hypothetical protein
MLCTYVHIAYPTSWTSQASTPSLLRCAQYQYVLRRNLETCLPTKLLPNRFFVHYRWYAISLIGIGFSQKIIAVRQLLLSEQKGYGHFFFGDISIFNFEKCPFITIIWRWKVLCQLKNCAWKNWKDPANISWKNNLPESKDTTFEPC